VAHTKLIVYDIENLGGPSNLNIKFIGRDMREKIKKENSSGIWFKVANRNLTLMNKKSN